MNDEIKAKWLEALRSGKYHQAQGWLRCDNAFCCLGVLCDIVDPNGWTQNDGEHHFYDEQQSYLTDELADRLGVLDKQFILSAMNDDGKSFEEIADYIEKNL